MADLQNLEVGRQIVEDGLLHFHRCVAGQQRLELPVPDQKDNGLCVGVRPW